VLPGKAVLGGCASLPDPILKSAAWCRVSRLCVATYDPCITCDVTGWAPCGFGLVAACLVTLNMLVHAVVKVPSAFVSGGSRCAACHRVPWRPL
jgi:hypothetical protein